MVAALAFLAALQAAASGNAGQFVCRLFDAEGRPASVLTVSVRSGTAGSAEGGSHPLVEIRPSNPAYPNIENLPASVQQLTSGTWEVVSRNAGPGRIPGSTTARAGYRLGLWTHSGPAHGYAILMADGPGSHFEIAGYRPIATGLCTSPTVGEQQ